jgi:hypothetical protein
MDTLLLDTVLWDLTVDAAGNWAVATEPYALAQDVSSAVRLFLGELWYDDTQGIDYFKTILGKSPSLAVFQELMVQAALTVPDVVSAVCVVNSYDFVTRHVDGQIQFIDVNGNNGSISLGNPA